MRSWSRSALFGGLRDLHTRGVSNVPPNLAAPGIELRGVAKSYGAVEAVRGIDLVVAPGETIALLGPNGAGKSTTLDLVLGLARPGRGTVAVFGVPPAEAVAHGWVWPPDSRLVRRSAMSAMSAAATTSSTGIGSG